MNNLLPIGSVVLTKDTKKKVVIVGYAANGKKEKIYDYIAFPYPEGFIKPDLILGFNHSNITSIIYKGLETKESIEVLNDIKNIIEKERQVI